MVKTHSYSYLKRKYHLSKKTSVEQIKINFHQALRDFYANIIDVEDITNVAESFLAWKRTILYDQDVGLANGLEHAEELDYYENINPAKPSEKRPYDPKAKLKEYYEKFVQTDK